MQSDVPDPSTTESPSTLEQEPSAGSSNKRPRLSSRPTTEDDEASDDTPYASSQRTLDLNPSRRASSRDTTEMHRSSTPPEASGSGPVKFTRTGRVSKATKGQRVHQCDECGKTYTRAEHLRRHQQNHKPGAFPCDVPGCGRSFHREDLLLRHKLRQYVFPKQPPVIGQQADPSSNDPQNPPSPRLLVGSQSSAPDRSGSAAYSAQASGMPQVPVSDPTGTQSISSDNEGHPSNPSARTPKQVIPPNELHRGIPSIGVSAATFRNPWISDSPDGPHEIDYESPDDFPGLPYHPLQSASRARYHSDASFPDYNYLSSSSRSPFSSDSSTILWAPGATSEAQYGGTLPAYLNSCGFGHRQSDSEFPTELPLTPSAEHRDYTEQSTLGMPSGHIEPSSVEDTAFPNYGLHLNAYWSWIHDLFPVIHQPTYSHEMASPLLRTAILALGGQAAGQRTALSNARVLHEKCLKALKNRTTQNTHTFRICDMQGIVLVEVYSLFKSRRPPHQFSHHFEQVFLRLSNDPEAVMSTPTDTPTEFGIHIEDYVDADMRKINILCKQRLLQACYVLEQQHNLLFGRSVTTCNSDLSFTLPFPASQQQWDGPVDNLYVTPPDYSFNQVSEAVAAISCMTEPALEPYDCFQSMLVLARICETNGEPEDFVHSCALDYPVLLATEQSPRAQLMYHTFMLCKTTPIRDILAVAGESWIMAVKMNTQAEYSTAQLSVRDWAMGDITHQSGVYGAPITKPAIHHALHHAIRILQVHQVTPKVGLLFQEWAVYLAAIVIWAKGYVLRGNKPTPRLSIPNPNEPRRSSVELEQAVTNIINAGPTGFIGWKESRNVLLWAKAKIERFDLPHSSGLTSGALDVLGKLIMRGDDDDWY